MNRFILFLLLLLVFLAGPDAARALPQRLVIAMDGISYRDVKALQEGIAETNFLGVVSHRRAFTADKGYFPVSRMISTFPSTSDVAWTDIFGNRPLPGYQRTYFSDAANSVVWINGLTSTVEHERQMDWQMENNFIRSMGYLYSVHTFEYELWELGENFLNSDNTNTNYYIYIRSSDDAQHMERNILSMLVTTDKELQDLRARYKAQTGHDLQILIISDHGHNHAGRGERVLVRPFLEKNGFRIAQSIQNSNDVVLPTAGIEDWIEIHNSPQVTVRLAEMLTQLKGVDIVTARLADSTNHFLVLNSKGERAIIQWNPANNSFRYSAEKGDPLHYGLVVEALRQKGRLDADGFASADVWMNETMTNHYPLALERIVRGLTAVTLNPATILVSLDNHYVHAGWLVNDGSMLVDCGSTHGALDDINTDGIVLSNFARTQDTSSDRVAGCFDNFPGMRNFRGVENGAEWIRKKGQARIRIQRDPFDVNYESLPDSQVFLHIWSPQLAALNDDASLETTIGKISGGPPPDDPVNLQPSISHERHYTFGRPISFPAPYSYEKVYACPPGLMLEPYALYRISGWMHYGSRSTRLFEFVFNTDEHGQPVAF